jgi:uncharacterized protein (DUF849 family)
MAAVISREETMNEKVVITCAVTGSLTKPDAHSGLPITPEEIASSSLEAAAAGAAVVHIHVRDPKTGRPSMEVALYEEVVKRIRAKNQELVINLTTGPGGRYVPSDDEPAKAAPGTTLCAPERRVEHVLKIKPDICSLDLNTMVFGGEVVINTPKTVTRMARLIREAGVKPEIEAFDSGDIEMAKALIKAGELEGPGMYSLVLGVKYGFPATAEAMMYARSLLPPGAFWSGFGISRMSLPLVPAAALLGGNVRVGLEDNLYISKGVLAPSNASLVEAARGILDRMGVGIATAREARDMLGLRQPPAARSAA